MESGSTNYLSRRLGSFRRILAHARRVENDFGHHPLNYSAFLLNTSRNAGEQKFHERSLQTCVHEENFMAIFTTLSVVIWLSTSTLGIFATPVYVFTMRVVMHGIPSVAIISTLSTSILFCNLCYILL